MVMGQLMGGIAQGMMMGRQAKVDKEERALKKQMISLQLANAKIAQQQQAFKNTLLERFMPTLEGGAAPEAQTGGVEAQSGPGLLDQLASAQSPMSPGPAEVAANQPAQMGPGTSFVDSLVDMDPMMAAILKDATGIDFMRARRDSLPKMGEADLIARANKGDKEAQAILDAQLERKKQSAAAGKTTVDIRNMGTIPPGYKVEYDQQGNPMQMAPIPGGPAAREIEAEETKAKAGSAIKAQVAQTAFEDIERSLEVVKKHGHLAAGYGGLTDWLPLSPAKQLRDHIDSVRGNIGIDSLLNIKASGAGLGQIPQAQLEMLASLLGKLDTKMHPTDLEYNLQRIGEIYGDVVEKEGGNPQEIYKGRKGRLGAGGKPPKIGTPPPTGKEKQILRTGTDATGRKVVQYSDGTISYAD